MLLVLRREIGRMQNVFRFEIMYSGLL